uniref:Hemerythrin n=1 Tax=Capilloventer sp. Capillo4 TaxID=2032692 RepID=A0A286RT28_9ANNE|nr:hemerythrin [Capilloventer sp. Capillo4]
MPGHHIPEPFCWDETFRVFYETLDNQHRGLFRSIFELQKHSDDGDQLCVMVAVMTAHFLVEEIIMKHSHYSDLGAHKHAHDDFIKHIKGLHTPVPASELNFCKDWLVNHIKDIDFKYKKQLSSYS